eukprot:345953_1
MILDKFNIHNVKNEITNLPLHDDYTNTHLLNDFHHIKYHHNTDQDDNVFSEIYEYITEGMDKNHKMCNHIQCKHFQRHFADRSMLYRTVNNSINNNNHMEYTSRLISRIHVYFIHSYDMDRLTLDEI